MVLGLVAAFLAVWWVMGQRQVVRAVAWDPRLVKLTVRQGVMGKKEVWQLDFRKTVVTVALAGGGEELVASKGHRWWNRLFCKGDRLEVKRKGEVLRLKNLDGCGGELSKEAGI